jgi:copper resistance protein B
VRLALACLVAAVLAAWPLPGTAQQPPQPPEHAGHDEHAGHGEHATPDHDAHDHHAHDAGAPALPPFIPPVTDADRAAAFPDLHGHAVHDQAVNYFVLFDQLEWQSGRGDRGLNLEVKGWVGRDIDRLWFRTEGDASSGRLEHGDAHLLYGRAIARWWDVVAGVRQDVRPGPQRTWAAVGLQGLAPYWFDVEATAYIGAGGRTLLSVQAEHDLLLTNRLIMQPLVGVEVHGRADPARGIAAGLSSSEMGLRIRYVIRREFAPYVGVAWSRRHFGTADIAASAGERTGGARLAVGVRLWM